MYNLVQAWLVAFLRANAGIVGGGINPANGDPRSVAVLGQVEPNQTYPYLRVTMTGSGLLEPDADPIGDFTSKQSQRRLGWFINVFSDWEPETRALAYLIEQALDNERVEVDGFNGWTRVGDTVYYSDRESDPDRVVRVGAVRVAVTMEAN